MSTHEQDAAEVARIREVLEDAVLDPPRHLSSDVLFGYVDGTLDDSSRAAAQAHLEECDLCREDVADLKPLGASVQSRRWMWVAAAAALALVFTLAPFFRRAPAPVPPPRMIVQPRPVPDLPAPALPRYANPHWNVLVEKALESGRLPYPDLRELRGAGESLRGTSGETSPLQPSGVVIDTTRPTMTWPRVENATYTVVVFDGDHEVVRSEPLARERWTAPRSLRRGRTYSWQVEAKTVADMVILPSPDKPPARFRVIDGETHDEIAAARRLHREDHLLLATLYARAGMEKEAKESLRRIDQATDPRVERLKIQVGR
ncbi:MAG TPA: zf-HC2 domain-containing protein [Thermoanaerobaculia bacterium]|jgi:hypothetical protein|nr:zf-HC2 domain-containing protein [Thermoanaerobaculia bacterium]